ncbi:MAG: hypothetical protein JKY53_07940 [Flavobacteriales bacterium]|nr:hypothetical protein [Flavobacteriales bacterium]
MKKYKLHKNESKITDQEVDNYKDFSQFRANYDDMVRNRHKVPLYKNKKMLLALLMILLVIWLLTKSDKKENDSIPKTNVEQINN